MAISQVVRKPLRWSCKSSIAESSTMSLWLEMKVKEPFLSRLPKSAFTLLVHFLRMCFTTGFMKRNWKSSGVFTPMNARRNNPFLIAFGSHGTNP